MLFQQLLKDCDINLVIKELKSMDANTNPDELFKAIHEMMEMSPVINNDLILMVYDITFMSPYSKKVEKNISVSGYSLGEDEMFSLTLTSWEEFLGLQVSRKTLSIYPKEWIVAQIVNEMTFWGFSNECVKNNTEKFISEINECTKQIKEGKGNFISWDEIKGDLKKELEISFDEKSEDAELLLEEMKTESKIEKIQIERFIEFEKRYFEQKPNGKGAEDNNV